MRRIVLYAALSICPIFVSCGVARLRPSPEPYSISERVDSVYVRDSLIINHYITVKEKGDTTYVTETKTEYRDRWRERLKEVHDTTFVPTPYEVTKVVEKELTSWQSFRLKAFWWMAAIIAAGVAIQIARIYLH